MTDHTATAPPLVAEFEVTSWEEAPGEEPGAGPRLSRATVRKRFHGAIEGTSVTQLLAAQGPGGRGYVASEQVTGTIDGRRGTVVLQHGGIEDGDVRTSFGHVVPGTGTGELAGLAGTAEYEHEGATAHLTLRLRWRTGG